AHLTGKVSRGFPSQNLPGRREDCVCARARPPRVRAAPEQSNLTPSLATTLPFEPEVRPWAKPTPVWYREPGPRRRDSAKELMVQLCEKSAGNALWEFLRRIVPLNPRPRSTPSVFGARAGHEFGRCCPRSSYTPARDRIRECQSAARWRPQEPRERRTLRRRARSPEVETMTSAVGLTQSAAPVATADQSIPKRANLG